MARPARNVKLNRMDPNDIWGDESLLAYEVVGWANNRVVSASDPKDSARPASQLSEQIGATVTPDGIGGHEALQVFASVLTHATRAQDDPMNLAYIPAAPTRAAVAFDAATSAANIFGGIWEAGSGAIWAENQALDWLIGLLEWPTDTAAGTFVPGGTIGNLSALHAARVAAQRRRRAAGLSDRPAQGWALIAAESAHSSITSAASVLDVRLLSAPVDAQGRLTGAAVQDSMAELDDAHDVLAVVASAGTTNEGIIDDLDSISALCRAADIWLHVDAAYGGAGLCAPSVRDRYRGVEVADSLIVDPHKWLFAPYDCCALLYRDGAAGRAAHTQTASYLDGINREEPNPSDLAIQLSRRARGLPFWFSLATHGTDRYVRAVEQTLNTARAVADGIRDSQHLRLLREPDLTVVVFDRPGWSTADYHRWSQEMASSGEILCIPTTVQGNIALRLAFVNPRTQASEVLARLSALNMDVGAS